MTGIVLDSVAGSANMPQVKNAIKEFAITFAIAAVIALFIRAFIVEAKVVPSESMVPTILIGDRVLVEKITYRFRLPERGEIVVFDPPERSKLKDVLIKRVIAVAGDNLEIRNGVIYINGIPQAESYVKNKDFSNFAPMVIPQNSIFVMGDNRPGSFDSRAWGAVDKSLIIGRGITRYWPLSRMGAIK
jgi:signal peptidase I